MLNLIFNIYLKPQIEQPVDCKNLFHMLYLGMSSENVTNKSTQTFIIDNEDFEIEKNSKEKKNTKVDINLLMDKVREEKRKRKKKILFS